MPDPVVDEVLAHLGGDQNLTRLAELLKGLTQSQRKALSGEVGTRTETAWLGEDGHNAAAFAVLGCVTGLRQVVSRLARIALDDEAEPLAVEIVAARQPHWLPSLPEALLDRQQLPTSFRLVRALVRAGLVDQPEFPEYVHAMVRGLVGWPNWNTGPTVLDRLRADPGLLEREAWGLFTTEGTGRLLSAHDGWLNKPLEPKFGSGQSIPARPERTWQHALVVLAGDGTIERARLIDAALSAFLRDWTASDIGWFVKLHHALQPTVDEMSARQATYGRLLTVEPAAPVSLGLGALGALLKARRLDIDVLTTNAPAVLSRSDKGPVTEALKLLDKAASMNPEHGDRIAAVASHALSHERVDVQERALSIVRDLVGGTDRFDALLAAHADGLAPSLQCAPLTDAVPLPAPDPRAAQPLQPVSDADELAELFGRLIEEADDPAEVERVMEGVARLALRRPTRGAEALVKRMDVLVGHYVPGAGSGQELRADLVRLGLVWLDGRSPGHDYLGREYGIEYRRSPGMTRVVVLRRPDWSLAALVTMRIHELAVAVAGGGATMLSFPTFRNGVLPAAVLNARMESLDRRTKPRPLDTGLAVLRVPPEEYGLLRPPAAHRVGRFVKEQIGLLARHRPDWELVVGPSKGRYRNEGSERVVTWRDRNAPTGKADNFVSGVLDRREPLRNLALEATDGEYSNRFEQMTAMWPLVLPHHTDLLAAHAHSRLNRALTSNRSATEPLLDAIGAAARPVGLPALSALILGLAAKNGVERARAVDAIVDLSTSRVLDGRSLGTQLSDLLARDVIVGARIVPGLADAARASRLGAAVVIDCLTAALPALPERRDAHQFVDLLAQLASQEKRTVALPKSLIDIATNKPNSMLAKACRRVPPAPP